jgi:hypothetical protein
MAKSVAVPYPRELESRLRKDPRSCPNCGGRHIETVATPKNEVTVSGNRRCRDCGCRWRPRMPRWGGYVLLVFGLSLAAAIVCFLGWALSRDSWGSLFRSDMIGFAGLTLMSIPMLSLTICYGWGVIRGTRGAAKIQESGSPQDANS